MGCCFSKQQDLYIDVPRLNSTTDTWVLRQASLTGAGKLLPFTAACPASYPHQTLTRVVLGEDHLFAALWEGHGGSQAARHCVATCYESLIECMKTHPDLTMALKQTLKHLDKTFFTSDIPDIVKAGVGATGVMMYINTRTNQCYVARMGDNLPFVTESRGSFNTASVDIKALTSSQSHRVLFCKLPADSHQPPSVQSNDRDMNGPSTYSNAIGLGFGKDKKWQQLWLKQEAAADLKQYMSRLPFISNDCEVSITQLAPTSDTIVLASEALLEVMPANEMGLLLQHFDAVKLNTIQQILTTAAAAAQDSEHRATEQAASAGKMTGTKAKSSLKEVRAAPVAAKAPSKPNVASIVMHHALSKVINQFNMEHTRHQQFEDDLEGLPRMTYEDLAMLPLAVDKEAFRPAVSQGSQVQLHLPKYYTADSLCKRDVHGDMGIVVIALNWPRSLDSQPLPGVSATRSGGSIRPNAQYRWQLLRSLVKFHIAYRRTLHSRWWQLIAQAQAAAEEAARQREVEAWKTKGEAVKVSLAGEELDPDAPMWVRRSPAKATVPHLSPGRFSMASASVESSGTERAAPAAPAFSTPHSISRPLRGTPKSGGSSRVPTVSGMVTSKSSSRQKDAGCSTPGAYSTAGSDADTPYHQGLQHRSDRKPLPGRLQITSNCDEGHEESDIESPKVDSPSKTAARQSFPVQSSRKSSASPTKPYGKQNLSLRSNRSAALTAEASRKYVDARDISPMPVAEASWGTNISQASTPKQALSSSRVPSSSGSAAADACKRLSASPACRAPSRETSNSGHDHPAYPGSAGKAGSPTKNSRAGKISLRSSKPAVQY